jgi:hypothetical protein
MVDRPSLQAPRRQIPRTTLILRCRFTGLEGGLKGSRRTLEASSEASDALRSLKMRRPVGSPEWATRQATAARCLTSALAATLPTGGALQVSASGARTGGCTQRPASRSAIRPLISRMT